MARSLISKGSGTPAFRDLGSPSAHPKIQVPTDKKGNVTQGLPATEKPKPPKASSANKATSPPRQRRSG
ncbi:MAG: hypothetical protein U0575_08890 [Phycisphaerales bacterium]